MNSVDRVGVIGLGLLGRGIAACFLSEGFTVVGMTPTQTEHEAAYVEIERMILEKNAHFADSAQRSASWKDRFQRTTELQAMSDCGFIVESVMEDIEVKETLLRSLESIIQPDVVIASNTSAIPISSLQQNRNHPERMIGMHWAEPAHLTRFLELIRGERTSDAAFETARALGQRLRKEPIACQKDIPGFIVNRIAYAMYHEACYLIESGVADAEAIDISLRNTLGLWASLCGPLRWIDISGGPKLYAHAMAHVLPTLCNTTEVPPTLRWLAEEDAMGVINGRGFYRYTPEEAAAWHERYHRHVASVSQMQDREFPIPPAVLEASNRR